MTKLKRNHKPHENKNYLNSQLGNITNMHLSKILCFLIFIMIDLQCSLNFCCRAKWHSFIYIYIYIYTHTHIYVYIHTFFFSHYPASCLKVRCPHMNEYIYFQHRKEIGLLHRNIFSYMNAQKNYTWFIF